MTDPLELAFRTGRPYVGLRGHRHDPALDAVVPPALAARLRVLPLAADGRTVRLASAEADPDLSALEPHLAGRTITLAVADPAELDAILERLPPPVATDQRAEAAEASSAAASPEAVDREPGPAPPEPDADEAAAARGGSEPDADEARRRDARAATPPPTAPPRPSPARPPTSPPELADPGDPGDPGDPRRPR